LVNHQIDMAFSKSLIVRGAKSAAERHQKPVRFTLEFE
jgi:hypothetical protein